jgi:hypothetical protein
VSSAVFCVCDAVSSAVFCGCDAVSSAVFCGCDAVSSAVFCGCDAVSSAVFCGCDAVSSAVFCECDAVSSAVNTSTLRRHMLVPFSGRGCTFAENPVIQNKSKCRCSRRTRQLQDTAYSCAVRRCDTRQFNFRSCLFLRFPVVMTRSSAGQSAVSQEQN